MTEIEGAEYPTAPTTQKLTSGDFYFSSSFLRIYRTAEDPIVYVTAGRNPITVNGNDYQQSQAYQVTIKADGYLDSTAIVTYYVGTSQTFSIIIDEDGDAATTEDQTTVKTWTAEELEAMDEYTFANGSSQCGMTGFRTFTTMGVPLNTLLEEANVTVSDDDYFLMDTSDNYGNNFTYEELFGTTRYFMSGIYEDGFAAWYEALYQEYQGGDTSATATLRRYLAERALENESTIEPRINSKYVETTFSSSTIATAVLPTEENTTFNSLVSYENQFRFVYGIAIEKDEVTVTFDSQGGSDVDSQKVLTHYMTSSTNTTWSSSYWVEALVIYRGAGEEYKNTTTSDAAETITEPEDPTRAGYTFAGWYTDADCTDGNEFDFTADDGTVDVNTTLYAKWEFTPVIESDHDYAENEDQTWEYTLEGAENGVYVTFSDDTRTESGYDYIYIYDEDGNLVGQYSGTELAGATVYVPTATFSIRLTSDSSNTYYGFAVTEVTAAGETIDLGLVGSTGTINAVSVGSEINPVVYLGDTVLTEGTDYTLAYDTSEAGVTNAVITGIGDYSGTLEVPFCVYDSENIVTITDFAIGNAEHDDADEELNQTIIATITFSEDIVMTADDLAGELLITIAGGDVYNTARDISYEVVNGNQLVITMVSTDWVAIYGGALEISDAGGVADIIDGLEAADSSKTLLWETQSGRIPTGIVVTNDIIEGTADAAASTYVNVAHKANMRGMFSFQLLSIVDGEETVVSTGTSHAHNFYTSVDEAYIASAIASAVGSEDGYSVEYTSGDTGFVLTADNATEGEILAVRMVEYGASINEAHASSTIAIENEANGTYDLVEYCSHCGDEISRTTTATGDTLGVRRGNTFYLSSTISGGEVGQVFTYGKDTDEVLVGDWDGDGIDTVAVRRGNKYYFSNDLDGGVASITLTYGKDTDEVLVGDWDGDGIDTLAVRRGNVYYFSNDLESEVASIMLTYGKDTDEVLVGDWDGDGIDTLTARRGNTYYFSNDLSSKTAVITTDFGSEDTEVLVGDWNSDGCDSLTERIDNVYGFQVSIEDTDAYFSTSFGKKTDGAFAGQWN